MSVKRALTGGVIFAIFAVYAMIFVMSLLTVALLEIRQANTVNFDSLVATLEQRDRFNPEFYQRSLAEITEQEKALRSLLASGVCSDMTNAPVPVVLSAGPNAQSSTPESCVEIKDTIRMHANELLITNDELLFTIANSEKWYHGYIDGIATKTPQIVPVLHFIEWEITKYWARSPLELFEMFLLILMGFLGGDN